MSDILVDAREWLADAPVGARMGRTHDETCHRRHLECLVRRLVEEVERLREERGKCVWTDCDGSREFETACGEYYAIRADLELYDYCPFCGGLIEPQDAAEDTD